MSDDARYDPKRLRKGWVRLKDGSQIPGPNNEFGSYFSAQHRDRSLYEDGVLPHEDRDEVLRKRAEALEAKLELVCPPLPSDPEAFTSEHFRELLDWTLRRQSVPDELDPACDAHMSLGYAERVVKVGLGVSRATFYRFHRKQLSTEDFGGANAYGAPSSWTTSCA